MRERVETELKELMVSELGVDAAVLGENGGGVSLLGRGIGLDSLEAVALVTAIEQRFDIHVADSDLTADLFQTLDTLVDYVVEKTSSRQRRAAGLLQS